MLCAAPTLVDSLSVIFSASGPATAINDADVKQLIIHTTIDQKPLHLLTDIV